MRYSLFILVLGAFLLGSFAPPARADDERRNKTERHQDRKQLRQDRRAINDDAADLAKLERLLERFDDARSANDHVALDAIDDELRMQLNDELGESKRESAQADRETRQSRRELRSDRKEIRDNRKEDASTIRRLDDQHDRRDDRRDLADDKADAAREKAQLEAKRRVAGQLKLLDHKHDASSLDAKRALIEELITLARAEQGQNAAERSEDKREIREDRRETREDRREG